LGNPVSIYTFIGSDGSHDWYRLSRYTYDEAGNKLSAETFSYGTPTSAGSEEVIVSAGDRVTYEYDLDRNPIRVVGPGNREVISDYDANGNLVKQVQKVRDGYYDVRRYEYDFKGRLTSEVLLVESDDIHTEYLPGSSYDNEYGSRVKSATTWQYYGNGSVKSKRDAEGKRFIRSTTLQEATGSAHALLRRRPCTIRPVGQFHSQTDPAVTGMV
jgi:uncharacterized protein RhaS with RHS repeats